MTQPDEAVTPEEVAEVIDENKKMEEFFKRDDPRAAIYAKHDAIAEKERPKEEPVEEPAPEEQASEVPVETPPEAPAEPPKEPQAEEEEVIDREEYERRTAKWKVKGKFDGEELVVPAAELVKITGLEKKAAKRLAEINRKERELLDRQYQVPIVPQVEDSPPIPQQTPLQLHRLSDAQVRDRYNELAMESPFDANAFLEQVKESRRQAQFVYEKSKAEVAQREFMDSNQLSEDHPDWQRINSREFYEKHPDIISARDRGDYTSMYAIARAHLLEEKVAQREAELAAKAQEAQKKVEAKKQGQVLRVANKPEPPKPKTDERETPEQYVRRMASERRRQFGIDKNLKI